MSNVLGQIICSSSEIEQQIAVWHFASKWEQLVPLAYTSM